MAGLGRGVAARQDVWQSGAEGCAYIGAVRRPGKGAASPQAHPAYDHSLTVPVSPGRGVLSCMVWKMCNFPELPTLTLNSQPYTLHPTPYTLHPNPQTLNPTPCNLHPQSNSQPQTLSPEPVSLNLTPQTLKPNPCTLKPTPYTPHPTPYTLITNH